MVYYSLAEEVPSYFSSASDFVNSSIVPSQLIGGLLSAERTVET